MCLVNTIDVSPEHKPIIGYKVFMVASETRLLGVYNNLIQDNDEVYYERGKRYETELPGFHVFVSRRDAELFMDSIEKIFPHIVYQVFAVNCEKLYAAGLQKIDGHPYVTSYAFSFTAADMVIINDGDEK